MNEYIKNKLIKSILEADLIINEINNEVWNKKMIRLSYMIIFFGLCVVFIKYFYNPDKKISD